MMMKKKEKKKKVMMTKKKEKKTKAMMVKNKKLTKKKKGKERMRAQARRRAGAPRSLPRVETRGASLVIDRYVCSPKEIAGNDVPPAGASAPSAARVEQGGERERKIDLGAPAGAPCLAPPASASARINGAP